MALGLVPVGALVLVLLLLLAVLRLGQLLRRIRRARTCHRSSSSSTVHGGSSRQRPLRTLVVLGSGGHTTEILGLVVALDPARYAPLHFCKAATDTTSLPRLLRQQPQLFRGSDPADLIHDIPRAREVGQSYASSILTTLQAQVAALRLVCRLRPDLIVCNGPGTCLPVAGAALLLRFCGLGSCELVFCESLCRVTSLSLTGRLLYPVADVFLVHWPELRRRYPLSQKVNVFVSDDE